MKVAIDVGARPDLWDEMDAQRRKTGGWWKNMHSLRVRLGVNVLDTFTVLELNIRDGSVYGVRILERGPLVADLRRGPHLTWDLPTFLTWFMDAEETMESGQVGRTAEVWSRNEWLSLQAGIYEITRVFTDE